MSFIDYKKQLSGRKNKNEREIKDLNKKSLL